MTEPVVEELARPVEELDWGPVLAFLPWLREPDPSVGCVVPGTLQDDGSWSWPYETLSPRAHELVATLRTTGVVADGVVWSRWLDGRGDDVLHDRDGAIARASLDDCRRLLVALVRQSRFHEGTMLDAFRDGRVRRALERVAELTGADR